MKFKIEFYKEQKQKASSLMGYANIAKALLTNVIAGMMNRRV